jgi:hypothetical protein
VANKDYVPGACPQCGVAWAWIEAMHGPGAPDRDSLTICFKCRAVSAYQGSGRWRWLTKRDWENLHDEERLALIEGATKLHAIDDRPGPVPAPYLRIAADEEDD